MIKYNTRQHFHHSDTLQRYISKENTTNSLLIHDEELSPVNGSVGKGRLIARVDRGTLTQLSSIDSFRFL